MARPVQAPPRRVGDADAVTEGGKAPEDAVRTWFDRHTPTFAARYRASRVYRFLTWSLIVLLPVAVALHVYGVVQKHRHDPRRQPAGAITVLVTERCPFSRELEAVAEGSGHSRTAGSTSTRTTAAIGRSTPSTPAACR